MPIRICIAAVGVHSGLASRGRDGPAVGAGRDEGRRRQAAGAPSGVPTIVFHGDADATVHPGNGEQVIAASAGAGQRWRHERVSARAGAPTRARCTAQPTGEVVAEHWVVHGAPHAWSGGSAKGSYTDPHGPDATAEMLRFFFEHPRQAD